MSKIRIRSIRNGIPTSWIYVQDKVVSITDKPMLLKERIEPKGSKRTNQYGRFRYSEKQYGKLISEANPSLEILTTPLRIRVPNNNWIYSTHMKIDGACPAIRIRSGYGNENGPWVYLQQKEV